MISMNLVGVASSLLSTYTRNDDQHRAANHYILAVVCYAQEHCATLLCS